MLKVFVLFCFILPSMQSRAIYLLFYTENALLTVVHESRVRSRTDCYAFPGALRASDCTGGLRLLPSAQGWTFGSWGCKPIAGNCVRFLSSRKCMRRWLGPGGHLFLPETGLVPPPSSPPLTVGRPKGMWRSPQSSALLPCSFARKAATPGRVIHTFRSGPVSSRPL